MNNNKKLINDDMSIGHRISLFISQGELIKFQIYYDHKLRINHGQYNYVLDKITGNKLQLITNFKPPYTYIRLKAKDRKIVCKLITDIVRKAYKDYLSLDTDTSDKYVWYDFEVNFPDNFRDTLLSLDSVRGIKMKRFLEGKY